MQHLEKISAVQRMQDYIEANIQEPITLHDLAKAAYYSPYHCSRVFKELLGMPPFDYIRKLRLARAALKLRDEKIKVIDVALDFVFDSHEGFTRAFSKEFGITPRNYGKNPPPIRLYMPFPVMDRYLHYLKGKNKMEKTQKVSAQPIFVQVIERAERKLMLKRGKKAKDYFEFCEEIGCDEWYNLWGTLSSVKEALYEPIGMWLPQNLRTPGTSIYAQGVELPADYSGVVPEGFEIITLPACKIMIFQGPPFENENFGEAIEDLEKAIQNYNPQLYGFEWAVEDAPRFQMEPQGYRGYIEGRPVRQINR